MINQYVLNLAKDLEKDIQNSYEGGITLPEAEKLASKFLSAQMIIANELSVVDLDARMKKSGVKAIRAAIYLDEVQKADKKPSDTLLEQKVNSNEIVLGQQEGLDTAEVERDLLQNYFNIAREGHIYFRNIARGKFE